MVIFHRFLYVYQAGYLEPWRSWRRCSELWAVFQAQGLWEVQRCDVLAEQNGEVAEDFLGDLPGLVNIQKTMENHHFGKSPFFNGKITIFNGYVIEKTVNLISESPAILKNLTSQCQAFCKAIAWRFPPILLIILAPSKCAKATRTTQVLAMF